MTEFYAAFNELYGTRRPRTLAEQRLDSARVIYLDARAERERASIAVSLALASLQKAIKEQEAAAEAERIAHAAFINSTHGEEKQ